MDKDKKRRLGWVIFGAVLIVLIILANRYMPGRRAEVDSGYRDVMGTFGRIVVIAANEDAAAEAINAGFAELREVDRLMSSYKEDSDVSRVNRLAGKQAVEVSEDTFEVIELGVRYGLLTDGAFDITAGPLIDLYRQAELEGVKPSDEEIAEARARVGFGKLVLDRENRTVRFAVEGMRIDLGGIAKGYGIDRAVEAAMETGALGVMVDVGGDIGTAGTGPGEDEVWLVALQDPREPGTLTVFELTDVAIATSGDYQRYYEIGDERVSHIFDPAQRVGAAELSSVSVIAELAVDADVLATAVSVMGIERGLALIERTTDVEALLIRADDKEIIGSSGIGGYIRE